MSGGFRVARCDETVFVRVEGLANLANTAVIEAFFATQTDDGVRSACVDLASCTGMDSTFMGALVGFHFTCRDRGGSLALVNPGPASRRLLDLLGVSTVVPVLDCGQLPAATFHHLEPGRAQTAVQRAEMVRVAHENLVCLSEANRAKFAGFLTALRQDVARFAEAAKMAGEQEGSKT